MRETVLVLEELVKDFDKKRAVDHISLKLQKGEILGLLGPNGAGKTTAMRMIMDIMAPDSGNIEIFGKHFSEQTKNRIGYLPEERGLYRKLKVSETLTFFGELKGMTSKSIHTQGMQLLEKFELTDYYDKKVEELSKGMAQKLQFIITIIHSPELLIFDEPFAGLDPLNIELVKDIILEKKREGNTIIFSSHLMEYAEKIVDSVVMINRGKKVLDGTLTQIKTTYGTRFVKVGYDGDSGFLSGLKYIKNIKDYGKEMEIELENIRDKEKLLKEMVKKLSINSFKVTEPSLNSIFIRKANDGEKP
ncbi:MAG: ATP-binding cassette domain-containing protein [Candidatus Aminicenantes bacterium]|nr:ATP-binding cassette domain-containing protein [Candidatus Aminicenantes bacterium]